MKKYYEVKALNFSTLAALDGNNPGNVFKESERISSIAMERGSLVDCLLTSPDEYEDLFKISNEISLSPKVESVIESLIDSSMDYNEDNIIFMAKEVGFGAENWSNETLLNKLMTDDTKKYFERKTLNTDKTLITQEMYDQAVNVVKVLKNHEFSKWIFEEAPGIEIKYQQALYWEDKGLECKALPDIIYIDHNNKAVKIIDLKVKSDSKYAFMKSFIRFKYYLQAVWYLRGYIQTIGKDYADYSLDFYFLVTSFEYPDPPLLYKMTDGSLDFGIEGGVIEGKKVKGIVELVEDYIWYKTNEKYDYPRHIYENKGVVDIEINC